MANNINPILIFTGNPQKTKRVLKDLKYKDEYFYLNREGEPLDKFYRRIKKDAGLDLSKAKMIAEISSQRNPMASIRQLAELQTVEILKTFPMISAGNLVVFPSIFKTDRDAFVKGVREAGAEARTSFKRALNYTMAQIPPLPEKYPNSICKKKKK